MAFYGRGCPGGSAVARRRVHSSIRRPLSFVTRIFVGDVRLVSCSGSGRPALATQTGSGECRRWTRPGSRSVLAMKAGTILLSGPRWAMASFRTPRGHNPVLGDSWALAPAQTFNGCSPSNLWRRGVRRPGARARPSESQQPRRVIVKPACGACPGRRPPRPSTSRARSQRSSWPT